MRRKNQLKRMQQQLSDSEDEDLDLDTNSNLEGLDPKLQRQIYGIGETLLRDLEKLEV